MPEALNDIITPSLILRLLGPAISNACLNNNLVAAQGLLHAAIPREFLDELKSLQNDSRQLQEDREYKPWATRAIILAAEMLLRNFSTKRDLFE